MKWLKRILLGVLVLILLVIAISFVLPSQLHVERSAITTASPEVVFNMVNNLKSYNTWMPWNQMDPNMTIVFGPTTSGKGAYYNWNSTNDEVGTGKLTISESKPNELVTTDIEFGGMGTSNAGFKISPEGNGSKVVWYIDNNYKEAGFLFGVAGKWMGTLGLMDKMMGKDFEAGLANLKRDAEKAPPNPTMPVANTDSLVMPEK